MISGGVTVAWHEVTDSHPAARTTAVHVCRARDPRSAAAVALETRLKLEPLQKRSHDRFVLAGGWSGWRVSSPEELIGKWIYTRPAEDGVGSWPPRTWLDCLKRYDRNICATDSTLGNDSSDGEGDWEERMRRDFAVAAAMTEALGTDSPMDPFLGTGPRIGGEVLKAALEDIRSTYKAEGPGTRVEPRSLSAVSTKVGARRATEHLVEPHFIDRAERWLRDRAAAGDPLGETDRLEMRLLDMLKTPSLSELAGCCAMAAMCELDPEAAELWYRTGGDCSGHPDIRQYAALARERLPEPAPSSEPSAVSSGGRRRKPRKTDKGIAAKARLVHCGAPTLTGSVCRHRVSSATPACPAGHPQNLRPS